MTTAVSIESPTAGNPSSESRSDAEPTQTAAAPSTLAVWARHLLCFVLPVTTFAFAATGPHRWWVALLFLLPLVGSVVADMRSAAERRQPTPTLAAWPFDGVLVVLVALQFVNIVLIARLVSVSGLLSADAFVAILLGGINSGYSAIVVAHELIHRASAGMQLLGRALMGTVLYEHFSTEHVRGHHARLGTAEDPATARFGETYAAFLRRTIPGQFRSAWQIERRRLGIEGRGTPTGWMRHRVVQGLVAEWGCAFALLVVFGPAAFIVHVLQAATAVSALEAVNYFEHWGIVRRSRRVRPVDSWDTESRFSLYTLVGLSRHADHHAYASRPYQQLRHWEESPKLPYGYFGMVMLVWMRGEHVRRLLTLDFTRRGRGPFAEAEAQAATSQGPVAAQAA
jgi:alkane 1-monooxygenase